MGIGSCCKGHRPSVPAKLTTDQKRKGGSCKGCGHWCTVLTWISPGITKSYIDKPSCFLIPGGNKPTPCPSRQHQPPKKNIKHLSNDFHGSLEPLRIEDTLHPKDSSEPETNLHNLSLSVECSGAAV
jgi:hypothetical protein